MEYGLVLVWLATFLVVGLAGLPLASVLFRRLPDRGASVAIPLSLTVVTIVVFWLGHASFGLPTLVAGLAVLVAASLVAGRVGDPDPDWRAAGETAAVFAAAFLFLVAVRAVDPAVHPTLGEKFLDFGLLKSILRSGALPPEDFWFAGEPVSYYYLGHLTSSLLAMLTGTAAKYAYNLALAGFYAMVVTGAYGLGGALADARGASRRVGGLWAAFFVGFASNLHTAGQVLLWALPDVLAVPIARWVTASPEDAATLLGGFEAFRYWDASRVIDGTINEFPLFAWLNGDLQAHMIGMPFLLVLAALVLSYYRTPGRLVTRRRVLVFGAVPVVGGMLGGVVTWAFPTVMGLTGLGLLFAPSDPVTLLPGRVAGRIHALAGDARARAEGLRMATAGVLAVGVQVLSAAWMLPFLLGQSAPWSPALFPDRSGLGELLLVHGAFLAVFAVYLVGRAPIDDRDRWLEVVIVVTGLLGISVVLNAPAVGLFGPLLVGAWVMLRRGQPALARAATEDAGEAPATANGGRADADGSSPDGAGPGFETVLVIAGAGLVLIVEFFYVDELAGPGRFNTVFKTYMQVWVLWSVAAGAVVATLVAEHLGGPDGASIPRPRRPTALRAGLALLVVSTSLYGALALPAHFSGEGYYSPYSTADDPTLDATQFVETNHPAEAEAIRWLDAREGQPNIVTAAPGGYFWTPADGEGASAPASLTGVPTVLGWHHEVGYRGREPVGKRLVDVETIYTGNASQQAKLLAKYDVEYVYVGPAERARYGEVDFEGVRGVGDPKEFGEVLIYPVDPANVSAPGEGSANAVA